MPGTRGRRSATKRDVALTLGGFAGTALETMAERQSLSPQELVSLAAEYYVAERNTPRTSSRAPRWLDELEDRGTVKLDVELRGETWEALRTRAREERTTVERLLEHATLQLIADLDAGRVTTRVAQDEAE
jgi:hypothetical protein